MKHVLTGTIVSTKMNKTVVVEVSRLKMHPRYKKYMRVTKRYKAHNEDDSVKVGERVRIELMRPLSRDKRWRVIKETS